VKFIHAADLHVDSPLLGLGAYEGAPVERLRGATRQALVGLVDLAIERGVDLVVLAGDLFDRDWTDFRTGLFFREQMVRLTRTGVRVFVVRGNHDAASEITKRLPAAPGVHEFDSRTAGTIDIPELGVAIHGRSFPDRAVSEDLVPGYPAPVPGRFNIGVLHTSLTGNVDHDPYAPTTEAVLASKGYDYFALGHIHARQIVREAHPRIVYPGNLQGRHAKETGPKGCELVTVSDGRIVATEFVALDVVRWHHLELDTAGLDDIDALAARFVAEVRALAADDIERLHAIRVTLRGESSLHHVEAAQPGVLAAAIQAATQDLDRIAVWIERVRLELRSPLDRAAAAARPDAFGDVVRLVDELLADEAMLRSWVDAHLDELPRTPDWLAKAATLSPDAARTALLGAEASVLAHLDAATAPARDA
jgi:exonuclease SbcD